MKNFENQHFIKTKCYTLWFVIPDILIIYTQCCLCRFVYSAHPLLVNCTVAILCNLCKFSAEIPKFSDFSI